MRISLAELAAGACLYLSAPRADSLKGRYVSANWDMEELERNEEIVVNGNLLKSRVAMV